MNHMKPYTTNMIRYQCVKSDCFDFSNLPTELLPVIVASVSHEMTAAVAMSLTSVVWIVSSGDDIRTIDMSSMQLLRQQYSRNET